MLTETRKDLAVWFNALSNRNKAILRTAWQSFVGAVLTMIIAVLLAATTFLEGGELDDAIESATTATRLLLVAVMTIATSVVTAFMNRGVKGARYPSKEPVQPPSTM